MNFDNQYYLEQIKLRDELKDNREKLVELSREQELLEKLLEIENKILTENKTKLESLKGIKNFIFNRKHKHTQRQKIFDIEKEIEDKEKELVQITNSIEELENSIKLQESMYKIELSDGINIENNVISINDNASVENIPTDSEKEVIVHCTDFFPRNKTILCNYDGNKEYVIPITYQGVTKQIKCISHRHTIHFAINNVAKSTGDGFGSWEQPKYIIIEPMDLHKEQFVRINPADSWTYGSVKLGENPILLVREDVYDSIPQQEANNYTIMKYSGDYEQCLLKTLKLCGIQLKYADPNYTGHFYSLEMATEISLDARHVATNYIKDNAWDGKSPVSFNEEELFALYEVSEELRVSGELGANPYDSIDKVTRGINFDKFEQTTGVPEDFAKFMLSFGIKKSGDMYTLKNDDEIYDELNILDKNMENFGHNYNEKLKHFIESYDFSEIMPIYQRYKEFQQKPKDYKSEIDVASMTCNDLFKFKNIDSAKVVLDKMKDISIGSTNISLTETGCMLQTSISDDELNHNEVLNMGLETEEKFDVTTISKEIKSNTSLEMLGETSNFMKLVETAMISNTNIQAENANNKTL